MKAAKKIQKRRKPLKKLKNIKAKAAKELKEIEEKKTEIRNRLLEEIKKVCKRLDIAKQHVETIQDAWYKERLEGGFGIINAITRAARTQDFDTRLEFEDVACKLLQQYTN